MMWLGLCSAKSNRIVQTLQMSFQCNCNAIAMIAWHIVFDVVAVDCWLFTVDCWLLIVLCVLLRLVRMSSQTVLEIVNPASPWQRLQLTPGIAWLLHQTKTSLYPLYRPPHLTFVRRLSFAGGYDNVLCLLNAWIIRLHDPQIRPHPCKILASLRMSVTVSHSSLPSPYNIYI